MMQLFWWKDTVFHNTCTVYPFSTVYGVHSLLLWRNILYDLVYENMSFDAFISHRHIQMTTFYLSLESLTELTT